MGKRKVVSSYLPGRYSKLTKIEGPDQQPYYARNHAKCKATIGVQELKNIAEEVRRQRGLDNTIQIEPYMFVNATKEIIDMWGCDGWWCPNQISEIRSLDFLSETLKAHIYKWMSRIFVRRLRNGELNSVASIKAQVEFEFGGLADDDTAIAMCTPGLAAVNKHHQNLMHRRRGARRAKQQPLSTEEATRGNKIRRVFLFVLSTDSFLTTIFFL